MRFESSTTVSGRAWKESTGSRPGRVMRTLVPAIHHASVKAMLFIRCPGLCLSVSVSIRAAAALHGRDCPLSTPIRCRTDGIFTSNRSRPQGLKRPPSEYVCQPTRTRSPGSRRARSSTSAVANTKNRSRSHARACVAWRHPAALISGRISRVADASFDAPVDAGVG